jgi:hypothetical protein
MQPLLYKRILVLQSDTLFSICSPSKETSVLANPKRQRTSFTKLSTNFDAKAIQKEHVSSLNCDKATTHSIGDDHNSPTRARLISRTLANGARCLAFPPSMVRKVLFLRGTCKWLEVSMVPTPRHRPRCRTSKRGVKWGSASPGHFRRAPMPDWLFLPQAIFNLTLSCTDVLAIQHNISDSTVPFDNPTWSMENRATCNDC